MLLFLSIVVVVCMFRKGRGRRGRRTRRVRRERTRKTRERKERRAKKEIRYNVWINHIHVCTPGIAGLFGPTMTILFMYTCVCIH